MGRGANPLEGGEEGVPGGGRVDAEQTVARLPRGRGTEQIRTADGQAGVGRGASTEGGGCGRGPECTETSVIGRGRRALTLRNSLVSWWRRWLAEASS